MREICNDAKMEATTLANAILCRSCNWSTRPHRRRKKKKTSMSLTNFSDDRDDDKIRRVIAHYEMQTEDEAVAEDEDGVKPSETVMNVRHDLVSAVRQLIAKNRE